ncbi:MAG: hypothetical protein AAGB18_00020 [Pseudomonadota bacterium]
MIRFLQSTVQPSAMMTTAVALIHAEDLETVDMTLGSRDDPGRGNFGDFRNRWHGFGRMP